MAGTTTYPVIDFRRYVEERTHGFTGREWVFRAVDDWLGDPRAPRFFLLTGQPGSGKTAIAGRLQEFSAGLVDPPAGLARLAAGFLAASHFCYAGDHRWVDPFAFANSLATQLANRYPPFLDVLMAQASRLAGSRQPSTRIEVDQDVRTVVGGQVIGAIVTVNAPSPERAFNFGVREPLEELFRTGFAEQVVIVVDGLDEALLSGERPTILSLLARAEFMPAGVRLIATSRREPEVLEELRRPGTVIAECRLSTGKGLAQSLDDVERHVLRALAERPKLVGRLAADLPVATFAATVRYKGDGNFLYAHHLLEMLDQQEGPIDRGTIDGIPGGLNGIYREFLRRLVLRARRNGAWSKRYAPVLGTLAVGREALTEGQLAGFVEKPASTVRGIVNGVGQFLDFEESLPGSRRAYAIYHRSFADFLLDPDRAEGYWCEEAEQHWRIVKRYRAGAASWATVDWARADDYGLRHLTYHVSKSGAKGATIADVLTPAFVGAQLARFGTERGTLADLQLAIEAARDAGDLALVLRWGWAYVGLRERAADVLAPETLPLRVRLGQTDRALEMIEELAAHRDAAGGGIAAVREQMAYALAEQDRLELALAQVDAIDGEFRQNLARVGVAQRVAKGHPARAVEIVAGREGLRNVVELCRALAAHDPYVDRAIAIARGDGKALEAIALEVARRDVDRALAVIGQIRPYVDESGGARWTRDADVARASLAIQVGATDPVRAVTIASGLRNRQESRRALVGVAAAVASADPARALEFVASAADPYEEDHYLAWSLALAAIAARSGDDAVRAEAARQWESAAARFRPRTLLDSDTDLLVRTDLVALRDAAPAHQIAHQALTQLKEGLVGRASDGLPQFRDVAQAMGELAAAIAVFDREHAVAFVKWASRGVGSTTSVFAEPLLLMVAASVARFDPTGAIEVVDRIGDFWKHLALVAVVETIGRYDVERALALVDSIDPQFEYTKIAVIGAMGNALGTGQEAALRGLLARAPRRVETRSFREPMYRAAMAVAGELARRDVDRGRALAERAAARHPDWALQAFNDHHRKEHGTREFLAYVIDALAEASPDRAVATIESEAWPHEYGQPLAIVKAAGPVAKRDWRRALDLARALDPSETRLRSAALQRVSAALPPTLPVDEVSAACRALVAETMAITPAYPQDDSRADSLRGVIDQVQRRPDVPAAVVADLLVGLASGDWHTFGLVLPDAIRLVCARDPALVARLEAELPRIEALLAS